MSCLVGNKMSWSPVCFWVSLVWCSAVFVVLTFLCIWGGNMEVTANGWLFVRSTNSENKMRILQRQKEYNKPQSLSKIEPMCPSVTCVTVIEHRDQGQGQGGYFISQFHVRVHHSRKSKQQELEAVKSSYPQTRAESTWDCVCWLISSFSPVLHNHDQNTRNCAACDRLLPTYSKQSPHKCACRPTSSKQSLTRSLPRFYTVSD